MAYNNMRVKKGANILVYIITCDRSSAQDIMKGSELAQDYEANIVLSKDCLFGYWTCFGNQSDQYVSICSGIQTHGISVCTGVLARKKKREKRKGW